MQAPCRGLWPASLRWHNEAAGADEVELFWFDPQTGELIDGPGDGLLGLQEAKTVQDTEERRSYVKRCLFCGHKPATARTDPQPIPQDGHDARYFRKAKRDLVRMKGLEPSRELPHSDLNAARLPIPPHPHVILR